MYRGGEETTFMVIGEIDLWPGIESPFDSGAQAMIG